MLSKVTKLVNKNRQLSRFVNESISKVEKIRQEIEARQMYKNRRPSKAVKVPVVGAATYPLSPQPISSQDATPQHKQASAGPSSISVREGRRVSQFDPSKTQTSFMSVESVQTQTDKDSATVAKLN